MLSYFLISERLTFLFSVIERVRASAVAMAALAAFPVSRGINSSIT